MRYSLRRPNPDRRRLRRSPGQADHIKDRLDARRRQLELDGSRLPKIL